MRRNLVRYGACFLALWPVWLLSWGSAISAEDCLKAREHYQRGARLLNYEERRQAFQAAVDLCPSFLEAHVNLADALENLALKSKNFTQENLEKNNQLLDAAIRQYEQALKHDNKSFLAHLGLAENYARIGLYQKAREAYKNALSANPHHTLASRAQAGLQSIEQAIAEEKDDFKSSQEIIQRYKKSARQPIGGGLMGFEDFSVVRDRQRFINIVFDEWSHALNRQETITQLEEIGRAVSSQDLARCRFVVEGHTDHRGDYRRNHELSWRRAEAMKAYLVERFGIDSSRITTQGFAYGRPRFPNDSEQNMLKNRRVELLIVEQTQ